MIYYVPGSGLTVYCEGYVIVILLLAIEVVRIATSPVC